MVKGEREMYKLVSKGIVDFIKNLHWNNFKVFEEYATHKLRLLL